MQGETFSLSLSLSSCPSLPLKEKCGRGEKQEGKKERGRQLVSREKTEYDRVQTYQRSVHTSSFLSSSSLLSLTPLFLFTISLSLSLSLLFFLSFSFPFLSLSLLYFSLSLSLSHLLRATIH